jgi:hypothetical protein
MGPFHRASNSKGFFAHLRAPFLRTRFVITGYTRCNPVFNTLLPSIACPQLLPRAATELLSAPCCSHTCSSRFKDRILSDFAH